MNENCFIKFYRSRELQSLPAHFGLDSNPLLINTDGKESDYRNKNIKKYWETKDISYNLNDFYFRTKHNFQGLKDNEFILVSGCSHSFGLGITENSRYSNIIEDELKTPVIDLSVLASDINLIILNITCFLKSFARPKLLIIQIPEPSRFSYIEPTGNLISRTQWHVYNNTVEQLKFKKPQIEYQGADFHANNEVMIKQILTLQSVVSAFKIPTIFWTPQSFSKNEENLYLLNYDQSLDAYTTLLFPEIPIYKLNPNDLNFKESCNNYPDLIEVARDHSHFGDLIHKVWSDKLLEIIDK